MERRFSLEEIREVARELLHNAEGKRHFAFYAGMGCGKTTLIRALCRELGVVDNVNSPTFSIVNEYLVPATGEKVFHMDWYRLRHEQDAIEAGVQDILDDPQAYCFIEWPEQAAQLLKPDTQRFRLEITSPNERLVHGPFFSL